MRRVNRVFPNTNNNNNFNKDISIGMIIPTTSNKRNFDKFTDCDFLKILLPSFLKNYDKDNEYKYNFYLGHDDDDKFFIENSTKIKDYFNSITNDRFNLYFHEMKDLKGNVGQIWSKLAHMASNNNEYLYQIGDDIKILTKGWEKDFISFLKKRNDIGVTGPIDLGRKDGLMTQTFVHSTHLSLFDNFYPIELRNWYIDTWITRIYSGYPHQNHAIINSGGCPRYNPDINDKKIMENISERDKNIVMKIRDKEIIKIKSSQKKFIKFNEKIYLFNSFFNEDYIIEGKSEHAINKIINFIEKNNINIYSKLNDNSYIIRTKNNTTKEGRGNYIINNRDNIENYYHEDPIFLIQQYYIPSDKERYAETKEVLKRNLNLKKFDKIYLLNEKLYSLEELGLEKEYENLIQIVIEKRLTYSFFLDFCKDLNGYCILSNSDIFFDENIDNVKKGALSKIKSIECLSRYEYRDEKNIEECSIKVTNCSQDAWILHSNFIENSPKFNFKLGVPGCDNKIAYYFFKNNYLVLNSMHRIKIYHYHRSEERNYNRRRLEGPYAFVNFF